MVYKIKELAVTDLCLEVSLPRQLDDGVEVSLHFLLAPPLLVLSLRLSTQTAMLQCAALSSYMDFSSSSSFHKCCSCCLISSY